LSKSWFHSYIENSFRSQIAEAYFNKYALEGWKAVSAGLKPAESAHPNAVRLMLEDGMDMSHKTPNYDERTSGEG